jgi:hypothetical protein
MVASFFREVLSILTRRGILLKGGAVGSRNGVHESVAFSADAGGAANRCVERSQNPGRGKLELDGGGVVDEVSAIPAS